MVSYKLDRMKEKGLIEREGMENASYQELIDLIDCLR